MKVHMVNIGQSKAGVDCPRGFSGTTLDKVVVTPNELNVPEGRRSRLHADRRLVIEDKYVIERKVWKSLG